MRNSLFAFMLQLVTSICYLLHIIPHPLIPPYPLVYRHCNGLELRPMEVEARSQDTGQRVLASPPDVLLRQGLLPAGDTHPLRARTGCTSCPQTYSCPG